MLKSIYLGIRNLLREDATLQTLLGGKSVFISHISQANIIPSVTILENTEGSKKRASYDHFKERDNSPIVQIDVWSKKNRLETVEIANRIDELLVANGVPNTRSWIRVPSGGDYFEQDTRIYHKPLRYGFSYKVTDS